MGLQDNVNTQVAAIRQHIADAQAATPPETVTVSFAAVRAALGEVANAIDALGGDSALLRTLIADIEDQDLDLSQLSAATGSHVEASAGLVSLLIDQSHFDGNVG